MSERIAWGLFTHAVLHGDLLLKLFEEGAHHSLRRGPGGGVGKAGLLQGEPGGKDALCRVGDDGGHHRQDGFHGSRERARCLEPGRHLRFGRNQGGVGVDGWGRRRHGLLGRSAQEASNAEPHDEVFAGWASEASVWAPCMPGCVAPVPQVSRERQAPALSDVRDGRALMRDAAGCAAAPYRFFAGFPPHVGFVAFVGLEEDDAGVKREVLQ